jgi:hypothetical protein
MYVVHTYVTYLVISIAITIWSPGRCTGTDGVPRRRVPRQRRAGRLDQPPARRRLLPREPRWIVRTCDVSTPRHGASAIELLSDKVGTVLFVLGVMHFFNVFLFSRYRRARAGPPVHGARRIAPTTCVPGGARAMTRLTVFYDARCGLCCAARDWLGRQPQLVPLDCRPKPTA